MESRDSKTLQTAISCSSFSLGLQFKLSERCPFELRDVLAKCLRVSLACTRVRVGSWTLWRDIESRLLQATDYLFYTSSIFKPKPYLTFFLFSLNCHDSRHDSPVNADVSTTQFQLFSYNYIFLHGSTFERTKQICRYRYSIQYFHARIMQLYNCTILECG